MLFATVVADLKRNSEETQQLVRRVPEPPMGYEFSFRQKEEQRQFFESKNDERAYASTFVDLYNYSIVAVCMYIVTFLRFSISLIFIFI